MEFWNDLVTEKSWKTLLELKKEPFRFVLIGGWAAYLWTKQHKSKDIDIIIPNIADLETVRKKYTLQKNDHLKKYEIKMSDFDIDIYIPWYSQFAIPVNEIVKQTAKIEGIEVVSPEMLLFLKQGAEEARKNSIKGQKDRIDILTLLCYAPVNMTKYKKLLEEYQHTSYISRLKEIISSFQESQYLGMNQHEWSKKRKELLKL